MLGGGECVVVMREPDVEDGGRPVTDSYAEAFRSCGRLPDRGGDLRRGLLRHSLERDQQQVYVGRPLGSGHLLHDPLLNAQGARPFRSPAHTVTPRWTFRAAASEAKAPEA